MGGAISFDKLALCRFFRFFSLSIVTRYLICSNCLFYFLWKKHNISRRSSNANQLNVNQLIYFLGHSPSILFCFPARACSHAVFGNGFDVALEAPLPPCLSYEKRKHPLSAPSSWQGASLTFGEVDDLTDTLAGWLYAKGVRVGSTVGIFMEHRAEYALAYIAAHKVSVGENKTR